MAWDWTKPKNYVLTNYIATVCPVVASPTPQPSALPVPSPSPSTPGSAQFPIGVWLQPYSSFDKWKGRGINTLVGPELEGNKGYESRWFQQGYAKGFQFIVQLDYMAEPKIWPGTVALMQHDEMDIHGPGGAPLPGEAMIPMFEKIRKLSKDMPIYCSFAGPRILDSKPAVYTAYAPYCTDISEDWYPINRNAARYPFTHKTLSLSKASAAMGGNKKLWSIIETSNQNINCPPSAPHFTPLSRAPTAAEWRGQVWLMIIEGNVKGLLYFPQQIGNGGCKPPLAGGFNFDVTPPDVVAEMKVQHALIQSKAGMLLEDSVPLIAPSPFKAATKTHKGKTYTLVLNLSGADAKYTDGKVFKPYEVVVNERSN